jgi:hypothetical protein
MNLHPSRFFNPSLGKSVKLNSLPRYTQTSGGVNLRSRIPLIAHFQIDDRSLSKKAIINSFAENSYVSNPVDRKTDHSAPLPSSTATESLEKDQVGAGQSTKKKIKVDFHRFKPKRISQKEFQTLVQAGRGHQSDSSEDSSEDGSEAGEASAPTDQKVISSPALTKRCRREFSNSHKFSIID